MLKNTNIYQKLSHMENKWGGITYREKYCREYNKSLKELLSYKKLREDSYDIFEFYIDNHKLTKEDIDKLGDNYIVNNVCDLKRDLVAVFDVDQTIYEYKTHNTISIIPQIIFEVIGKMDIGVGIISGSSSYTDIKEFVEYYYGAPIFDVYLDVGKEDKSTKSDKMKLIMNENEGSKIMFFDDNQTVLNEVGKEMPAVNVVLSSLLKNDRNIDIANILYFKNVDKDIFNGIYNKCLSLKDLKSSNIEVLENLNNFFIYLDIWASFLPKNLEESSLFSFSEEEYRNHIIEKANSLLISKEEKITDSDILNVDDINEQESKKAIIKHYNELKIKFKEQYKYAEIIIQLYFIENMSKTTNYEIIQMLSTLNNNIAKGEKKVLNDNILEVVSDEHTYEGIDKEPYKEIWDYINEKNNIYQIDIKEQIQITKEQSPEGDEKYDNIENEIILNRFEKQLRKNDPEFKTDFYRYYTQQHYEKYRNSPKFKERWESLKQKYDKLESEEAGPPDDAPSTR